MKMNRLSRIALAGAAVLGVALSTAGTAEARQINPYQVQTWDAKERAGELKRYVETHPYDMAARAEFQRARADYFSSADRAQYYSSAYNGYGGYGDYYSYHRHHHHHYGY